MPPDPDETNRILSGISDDVKHSNATIAAHDVPATGPQLAETNRLLAGLRTDVQEGNASIVQERTGRRQSIRLTRIAIVALAFTVVAMAAGGGMLVVRYIEATQITCETRSASRADTRAGIAAAADEVADYAGVPAADREKLNERVAERVAEKVGPPDC